MLFENEDIKYRDFHKKIVATKYEIIGIRLPKLKEISKQLLKKYDLDYLLDNLNNHYYEEVMLEGLLIANAKIDDDRRTKLIDKYNPKIDNWAICDTFCSSLKVVKKNQDYYLKYINKYLNSKKEYYLRFGIVILLNYYINDNYYKMVYDIYLNTKSNYYYVNMAIAWGYSYLFIKYFEETRKFFIDNKDKIDKWIYNKAIQKSVESFRISKENKDILKKMKI